MARQGERRASDWLLAAEACLLLIVAHAAIRMLPFTSLARTIGNGRPAQARGDASEAAQRIDWAIRAAVARLPLELNCLRRGLAASWMLRRRGYSPRMHYGVARSDAEGFRSHVWVELQGHKVTGYEAEKGFALLTTFPPVES